MTLQFWNRIESLFLQLLLHFACLHHIFKKCRSAFHRHTKENTSKRGESGLKKMKRRIGCMIDTFHDYCWSCERKWGCWFLLRMWQVVSYFSYFILSNPQNILPNWVLSSLQRRKNGDQETSGYQLYSLHV